MKNIALPGTVLPTDNGKWVFGVIIGGRSLQSAVAFDNAETAKSAMREYVEHINFMIDERINEAITVTGGASDFWPLPDTRL